LREDVKQAPHSPRRQPVGSSAGDSVDQAAFRAIISGERRGFLSDATRCLLSGFSVCYGCGVRTRNCAFDLGLKRFHQAPVPVVSVGNITTGGTGKTPFVAYLAHWFQQRSVRAVILSRGYHSLPGQVNDEKLMLDQFCPGVPHLQNPNRVRSAQIASDEHDAQVLILDDGFQHRRLARDLDIVLIDALNPFGYNHLLPRGLLREPPDGLQRADLIVITRADQCSDAARQAIIERIGSICGSSECVELAYPPECLINSAGKTIEFDTLRDKSMAAFCGIGNPDGFAKTIVDCGLRIADSAVFSAFPDHHHYTSEELSAIGKQAGQHAAAAILTTQKDLVKINRPELSGCPLWAVKIGIRLLRGSELLDRCLRNV